MENRGVKVETDSDVNSEDIDAESGDEEREGIFKKTGDKKGEKEVKAKEHKPVKKSPDEIKKSLFLGEKYGHYKIGNYVRIEIQVEKKFSRQLNPEYPVILCSLKHQETGFAYVRVKIKKHRWYPHIMKTKDPLTFSMGWRKFQSIPVYT
jgi:ribosome biogenesis protein BMS1